MRRVICILFLLVLVMGCPAQAVQWLKQSTAKTIKLGPFVDSTDGVTPETGLTISQADIRVSKNGGDFAQTNNAAGATHDENGWYDVPLDTTDTGTLGTLTVAVYESGAFPVLNRFMVVPANVWDSFFGADYLQVDRIQVGGTANASATIANAFGGSTFQTASDVKTTIEAAGSHLTLIKTKTDYLPSATAGAAGGVFIAGSNAATSITTALTANITGNLSGSVGSVTNGVSLADDAITASKFDESTAFPLKSADTGSTAVARTGADSDTLETLSDQLDGVVSGSLTEEEMIASMRKNLMEAAIDADPNTDSLFDIGARLGVLEAKLASMIESDGSTGWEYTAASLINSPTGSGGFTTDDRTKLETIHGKLPTKDFLTGTANSDGDIQANEATGNFPGTVGKSPATLAAADVSGNIPADVINWKSSTAPAMTGDAFARLGAPAGASVSADIAAVKNKADAIEADTQDLQVQIGTDGAGLTAIGDTRIANLDATVSSRSSHDAAAVKTAIEADGSKVDHLWEMTEDDGGTRRYTSNALEQAPTGTGSGLTAQQTRDAMKLPPSPGAAAEGSVDDWFSDLKVLIEQIISVLSVVVPQ